MTAPADLRAAVTQNCLIADARHARNYTLCTYLLKMREYYRWEKGYGFADSLPKDELGNWLAERERLWETVEENDFIPLSIAGTEYDPFESDAINRALLPLRLVYSGGYGGHATPHFFLGELLKAEEREGYTILLSGDEHVRDLAAPPAMTQGRTVYVRRESLRRMLWERIEEWRWKSIPGPMERALSPFGFDQNPDAALETMTDWEMESAVLHELGECRAGELLGPDWNDMLLALAPSRAELIARAVRDHLADSLCVLPALLAQGNAPSLHFYFANLRGLRRELYPEIREAYRTVDETGRWEALGETVETYRHEWLAAARLFLDAYRSEGEECRRFIEAWADCPGPTNEQPCACVMPAPSA